MFPRNQFIGIKSIVFIIIHIYFQTYFIMIFKFLSNLDTNSLDDLSNEKGLEIVSSDKAKKILNALEKI